MMIPALLGAPPTSAFGHVIGAVDPTQDMSAKLSVREYIVSGQKVWGSYQCAPCNDAIIRLKKRLNAFVGVLHRNALTTAGTDAGLIGDPTVDLARAVATYASANYLVQGAVLSGVSTTKQMLAERAHYASELVRQIGESLGFDVDRAGTTNPPRTPTPPSPTPSSSPAPPANVPVFDPSLAPLAPSPSFFSRFPRWSWYVAGGVLLAGLVTATVIVWKE